MACPSNSARKADWAREFFKLDSERRGLPYRSGPGPPDHAASFLCMNSFIRFALPLAGLALASCATTKNPGSQNATFPWPKKPTPVELDCPIVKSAPGSYVETSGYGKTVREIIGKQWTAIVCRHFDQMNQPLEPAVAAITFHLSPKGKVLWMGMRYGSAPKLTALSAQAIRRCEFPPMPSGLASMIPPHGYVEFTARFEIK